MYSGLPPPLHHKPLQRLKVTPNRHNTRLATVLTHARNSVQTTILTPEHGHGGLLSKSPEFLTSTGLQLTTPNTQNHKPTAQTQNKALTQEKTTAARAYQTTHQRLKNNHQPSSLQTRPGSIGRLPLPCRSPPAARPAACRILF
jgi:hypothetical protein